MSGFIGIWAIGPIFTYGVDSARLIIFLISVAYIYVAYQAISYKRWAVIIVTISILLLLIRWLPMVLVNFYMFFTGAELYLDSPATILVVIPLALLFALPSLLLFCWFCIKYKKYVEILKGKSVNA
jgi:hypothetical protein